MKRKLLSVLLSLSMALTLLPVTALAIDGEATGSGSGSGSGTTVTDTQEPETTTKTEAEKLQDAATAGGTYTLTSDVELTEKGIIVNNKEFTLDLNGHKITAGDNAKIYDSYAAMIYVTNSGKLTIKNDKTEGGIIAAAGDSYCIAASKGGTCEIRCTNETQFTGNIHSVYVWDGSVAIYGGRYDILQHYNASNYQTRMHAFVLNIKDANSKDGSGSIVVHKGVIVGVDPSNTTSDPKNPTNYVASTSKVAEKGTAQCQIPANTETDAAEYAKPCTENLKVYEVSVADGLSADKGQDGTITISGIAGGKIEEGSDTPLEGTGAAIVVKDSEGEKTDTTVSIPAETAATMNNAQSLTVESKDVTVELPKAALEKVAAAKDEVTIKVKNVTSDSGSGSSENGPLQVVQVSVVKADDTNVLPSTATDNGDIKITMKKETNAQFVYYVVSGADGKDYTPVEKMEFTEDSAKGTITITTKHLSLYAQYKDDQSANLPVAMVGDTAYSKLDDAFNAAKSGETVKLMKKVELESTLNVKKTVTLDLNGYELTKTYDASKKNTGYTISVEKGGTTGGVLTIIDTKGGGVIDNLDPISSTLRANNDCKLILGNETDNNFTVKNTGPKNIPQNSVVKIEEKGELVMNGGTVNVNVLGNDVEGTARSMQIYGKAVFNGGTINADVQAWGYKEGNANYNADITINGGEFKEDVFVAALGNGNSAFKPADYPIAGKITIPDTSTAVIEGDVYVSAPVVEGTTLTTETSNLKIDIAGGSIKGTVVDKNYDATDDSSTALITVSGGSFGEQVKEEYLDKTQVNAQLTIPSGDYKYSYFKDAETAYEEAAKTSGAEVELIVSDEDKTDIVNVTFYNGNTKVATYQVKKGEAISTLPSGTGITNFNGWYTAASGGTQITKDTVFDADTDVYAHIKSGGGGGGGTVSGNAVTVSTPTNGKVTVSPTNANKGTTVTITVTPNDGYEVGSVNVKDADGNSVSVTKVSDTKYTFTMPDSKVTVSAAFTQVQQPVEPGDVAFTDVSKNDYFYDAVQWAIEQEITNGTSPTTFSPNESCTRAQMVTFLWRAAGSPEATGTTPFTDLADGMYYNEAVQWAVSLGITNGTSETTFSPDETVTRSQTVTFLYRYAGAPDVTIGNDFVDVDDAAYFASAVQWAVDNELTNGTSPTTFSPNESCTRGQIVTFLYREMA